MFRKSEETDKTLETVLRSLPQTDDILFIRNKKSKLIRNKGVTILGT